MATKRRGRGQGTLFKRNGTGPWIAAWHDFNGKRREKSTRTTDRAAAQRILSKHIADTALRREGVIDPRKDRFAVEGRKALSEHIRDYINRCRRAGHAARHVYQKENHLRRLLASGNLTRLSDLTADALERHLRALEEDGLSARTVNFARQIAIAFLSWCMKTGRVESNPLTVVPKLDEKKDRRRVRRPLTDDELARLLEVAEGRGRKAWYLAAAMAGLRKGDLQRLRWCDIDFEHSTITILDGKASRTDVIPMHPDLAIELKALHDESMTVPTARVFPQTVTDRTRQKDFLRAGIAREGVVRDAHGNAIMIGKGKRRRAKTHIITEDEEGRVVDLHAMRTTLGTNLARAGVAPQIAQKIMRHGDYKTTLQHYTVLGLTDTASAIANLPSPTRDERERATGTCGIDHQPQPQRKPQHQGRDGAQRRASRRDEDDRDGGGSGSSKSKGHATLCDSARRDTIRSENSSGCNSMVECQLPKLKVGGSSPLTPLSPVRRRCASDAAAVGEHGALGLRLRDETPRRNVARHPDAAADHRAAADGDAPEDAGP